MRKIIAVILMLAVICAAFSATAEEAQEPVFATMGDVLQEAGEKPPICWNSDSYSVVLEKDGAYIRAFAYMDETAREMVQAEAGEGDYEKRIAIHDKFDEYIRTLPVAYTERITAEPLSQGELDAYTGKTFKDLEDTDFDLNYGELRDEDAQEYLDEGMDPDRALELLNARNAVLRIENGLFAYEFTLDMTRGEYMEQWNEDGAMDNVSVSAACFAGLSKFAADPEYLADGTFTGITGVGDFSNLEEMGLGEVGIVLSKMAELMNGEEGADLDPETLINALIKAVPDQEETIRMIVPAIMEYISQQTEEPAGE